MSYALIKSLKYTRARILHASPPSLGLCNSREIVTDSKGQRVTDHFEIKVAAFEECRAFYMNALEPLGIELKWSDENAAGFGLSSEPNVRFLIEKGSAIQHATSLFLH